MIRNVRPQTLVGEITVFDGIARLHHQSSSISRYLYVQNLAVCLIFTFEIKVHKFRKLIFLKQDLALSYTCCSRAHCS